MIAVAVTKIYNKVSFSSPDIKRIVEFVCTKKKIKNAELSFVIVSDRVIRTINKKFLHHDYVTDVITFPLETAFVNAEIYINGQQAKRQAKENQVTIRNEIIRLVVHGVLHAIGYDDTSVTTKKKMDSIQERYVSELNLML